MTSCSVPINCTIPSNGVVPFQADPDISGIGVILSFIITAWCVVLLVALSYFFGATRIAHLNPIDLVILFPSRSRALLRHNSDEKGTVCFYQKGQHRAIQAELDKRLHKFNITPESYSRALLYVTDIQIVTGAAILIVGFVKHCTISQYHFQTINNLALLCATALSGSVNVFGKYLRKNRKQSYWRIVAIFCLLVLFYVSTILSSNSRFLLVYGLSTQCAWRDVGRTSGLLALFLLVMFQPFLVAILQVYSIPRFLALPTQMGRLYVKISAVAKRECEQCEGSPPSSVSSFASYVRLIVFQLLRILTGVVFYGLFVFGEVFSAGILGIATSLSVCCLATVSLFQKRKRTVRQGMIGDENTWGFGQVMPMLLLVLPIAAVLVEIFSKPDKIPSTVSDVSRISSTELSDFNRDIDTTGTGTQRDIEFPRAIDRAITEFDEERGLELDSPESFRFAGEPLDTAQARQESRNTGKTFAQRNRRVLSSTTSNALFGTATTLRRVRRSSFVEPIDLTPSAKAVAEIMDKCYSSQLFSRTMVTFTLLVSAGTWVATIWVMTLL